MKEGKQFDADCAKVRRGVREKNEVIPQFVNYQLQKADRWVRLDALSPLKSFSH